MKEFDYSLDFEKTDFRANPHLYRIGRGEQGVLTVQPYKSEILPHWRFATPQLAQESSAKILQMFYQYWWTRARIFKQAWDQAAGKTLNT